MADKTKTRKRLDSMGNRIEFDYDKSNLHRVIKVDGAWGGVLPQGSIQMSVFSEVRPYPKSETYQVDEKSNTATPIKASNRQNFLFRELEATLIMTPSVAKSLAEWLTSKVQEYEKLAGLENPTEDGDSLLSDDQNS